MKKSVENTKIKVEDVRKLSPLNYYRFNSFTGHFISSAISPLFTALFIKRKVKPNTITLFMILCGIIGSILFAFPSLITKIFGVVFFHLWFIMDCSDGEVARITKTFSKYGKEMDFMAHLIDHPLMNLSLWITFILIDIENWFIYSLLFILFISLELINRSLTLFTTYLSSENKVKEEERTLFKYIVIQFSSYPNFILIYPAILLVDLFLGGFVVSQYILFIWFGMYAVLALKSIFKFLYKFYYGL